MMYTKKSCGLGLTVVLGSAWLTACAPQPKPVVDPMQDVSYKLPEDIPTRIRDLQTHVVALASVSFQMPGATREDHARLAGNAFDELLQVLPTFEGDQPTEEFNQSLRVIKQSKSMLATPSLIEPAVTQGLIASESSLRGINRLVFANNPEFAKQLDETHVAVSSIDSFHEAQARLGQAAVLKKITAVAQDMTAALVEKAGIDGKAVAPVKTEKPVEPDAPKP